MNRHEAQVYSTALYILRDRSEAEDVTQEVYIRLWNSIKEVESDKAKAWLMKVTKNLCIDHLRARHKAEDINEYEFECVDSKQDPAKALAHMQLSRWLREAIDKLKEPYRSLIVLSHLHQKNYREIAQSHVLTVNQVKVYIHRARQQLRTLLQEVEL